MANIDYDTQAAAGFRSDYMFDNQVRKEVSDMTQTWTYPGVFFVGNINKLGTKTHRLRYDDIGNVSMTALNEGVAITETDPNLRTVDVSVGRYGIGYNLSELANITGYGQSIDSARLASGIVRSGWRTLSEIITATFPAGTNTVGTTGQPFTYDDFLEAKLILAINNNNSPTSLTISAKQYGDLEQSIRNETGTFSLREDMQDMFKNTMEGFQGTLGGIAIFRSNLVPDINAAVDKAGAMMALGAVGYNLGRQDRPKPGLQNWEVPGNVISVTSGYNGATDIETINGNMYAGAALADQNRFVQIISRAA